MTAAGFVVARENVKVTCQNGSRSTILAGTLRKADNDVVTASPESFYTPETHYCHVEVTQIASDDGRQLETSSLTYEVEGAPPPADAIVALRQVEMYWQDELGKTGDVLTLGAQRTGRYDWVVRSEVVVDAPRAAEPPQIIVNVPESPPVVNVTIDSEPVEATVTFDRGPDGQLQAATITEA